MKYTEEKIPGLLLDFEKAFQVHLSGLLSIRPFSILVSGPRCYTGLNTLIAILKAVS